MKRLSNKIIEIKNPSKGDDYMYNLGHTCAKHQAACMAIKYDDVMATMLNALQEAVDCGIVPKYSAKEGGAARNSRQVCAADQIREAISKASELSEHQTTEGVE